MTSGEPPPSRRAELDDIALVALRLSRRLMETGARAEIVHEDCARVARGLGADHIDLRSDYGSLGLTIAAGPATMTRMIEIGALGVNYRLNHALRDLAGRIGQGGLGAADAAAELAKLEPATPRHPSWFVALAVGLACAAFGRLLGVDWAAFVPIAAAGAAGRRCATACSSAAPTSSSLR